MRITIIAVGKIKEDYLRAGIAEYMKRFSTMAKVEVKEIAEERLPANPSAADENKVREEEGKRILAALPEGCCHVAMDIEGKRFDSPQLAEYIAAQGLAGCSHVVFTIGGSLGLSDAVKKAADLRLSFSPLTFPHQLFRLMLVEQIYRALKINRGEQYHK